MAWVKTAPSSVFIMTKAKLLRKILIVALNAPAHLGDKRELLKARISWRGTEKVLIEFY